MAVVRSKAHGTEPVRSWPWLCQPHTGVCLPPPEESAQDAKAAGTALVVLVGFAGELGGGSQTNTLRSAGQTEIMNRASQSIGTMGWSHPNKTLGVGGRSPGRPPPLLPSAVHSRQAEQTVPSWQSLLTFLKVHPFLLRIFLYLLGHLFLLCFSLVSLSFVCVCAQTCNSLGFAFGLPFFHYFKFLPFGLKHVLQGTSQST